MVHGKVWRGVKVLAGSLSMLSACSDAPSPSPSSSADAGTHDATDGGSVADCNAEGTWVEVSLKYSGNTLFCAEIAASSNGASTLDSYTATKVGPSIQTVAKSDKDVRVWSPDADACHLKRPKQDPFTVKSTVGGQEIEFTVAESDDVTWVLSGARSERHSTAAVTTAAQVAGTPCILKVDSILEKK